MNHITKELFLKKIQTCLYQKSGVTIEKASNRDLYLAMGNVLNEEIGKNLFDTIRNYQGKSVRQAYYLSMEFLTGKFARKNLQYLNIYKLVKGAFEDIGRSLDEILDEEADPGLGNGGLGRLAAAFLDSLASLQMPGHGYGLRYEKGLFKQRIIDKEQVEGGDNWLEKENIWEYRREEESYEVRLGGRIDISYPDNKLVFNHVDYDKIKAVAYDIPILGYRNNVANYLRLWSAESYLDIDFKKFAKGEHKEAFKEILEAKGLTQFLYPEDSNIEGKKLRLKQEYFLVSASLQDIIKKYKEEDLDLMDFHKFRAIQINDTHPALAIPEFMRILMDENNIEWNDAWNITIRTFAFTNHTILSEAMERWHISLFIEIIPRIWMIIEEINNRFIHFLRYEKKIEKQEEIDNLSIIGDNEVRMVNLAIMGSHSVNGVAELHTKVLKEKVLNDFYKIYPEKFNNKTNGIVHRRWLLAANPELTNFLKELIGHDFINDARKLENLLEYKENREVLEKLQIIKHRKKERLADFIFESKGIRVDPNSIFDIHIKRIHEYKRQFLNILHIMYLYNKLKEDPNFDMVPQIFIFAGKAAPGYYIAKEIIRLIETVASVVNNDLTIKGKLKVVFIENYNVSKAELLIPAADISQQISTTTKEASGTGNMKFMMNGALTIATLDGANVEISRAVGEENIFLFGLRENEVYEYYNNGNYNSKKVLERNPHLSNLVEKLVSGDSIVNEELFQDLHNLLVKYNDTYFLLEDFNSYRETQERLNRLYRDRDKWNRISLINIAKSGIFSSDNTIRRYAEEIWNIKTVEKDPSLS